MAKPHNLVVAFLLLALFSFAPSVRANPQQAANRVFEERDRGIELHKQGNMSGAIESLRAAVKRNKDDITAWHYLGLALTQLGKKGDARKAHEKAAKIADALLTSLSRLPKEQVVEAADSADQYLALSVNPSKKKGKSGAIGRNSCVCLLWTPCQTRKFIRERM